MRLAAMTVLLIALVVPSVAQAHNVSRNGKDRLSQYFYYKANQDHALKFLDENISWRLIGKQHDVWPITTTDITYHKRLYHNATVSIRKLIPHKKSWYCIHRYEGAWNDPNAPYFGGLQMDLQFQSTYGSRLLRTKGTANYWTPIEQMIVAEIAYYSGRGFYPWPNTARYCGLL